MARIRFSTLPVEIIEKVANELEQADIFVCLTLSRLLHSVFEKALYLTAHVDIEADAYRGEERETSREDDYKVTITPKRLVDCIIASPRIGALASLIPTVTVTFMGWLKDGYLPELSAPFSPAFGRALRLLAYLRPLRLTFDAAPTFNLFNALAGESLVTTRLSALAVSMDGFEEDVALEFLYSLVQRSMTTLTALELPDAPYSSPREPPFQPSLHFPKLRWAAFNGLNGPAVLDVLPRIVSESPNLVHLVFNHVLEPDLPLFHQLLQGVRGALKDLAISSIGEQQERYSPEPPTPDLTYLVTVRSFCLSSLYWPTFHTFPPNLRFLYVGEVYSHIPFSYRGSDPMPQILQQLVDLLGQPAWQGALEILQLPLLRNQYEMHNRIAELCGQREIRLSREKVPWNRLTGAKDRFALRTMYWEH